MVWADAHRWGLWGMLLMRSSMTGRRAAPMLRSVPLGIRRLEVCLVLRDIWGWVSSSIGWSLACCGCRVQWSGSFLASVPGPGLLVGVFDALGAGGADGVAAALVLVVWGGVADRLVQADAVVVDADSLELG